MHQIEAPWIQLDAMRALIHTEVALNQSQADQPPHLAPKPPHGGPKLSHAFFRMANTHGGYRHARHVPPARQGASELAIDLLGLT